MDSDRRMLNGIRHISCVSQKKVYIVRFEVCDFLYNGLFTCATLCLNTLIKLE